MDCERQIASFGDYTTEWISAVNAPNSIRRPWSVTREESQFSDCQRQISHKRTSRGLRVSLVANGRPIEFPVSHNFRSPAIRAQFRVPVRKPVELRDGAEAVRKILRLPDIGANASFQGLLVQRGRNAISDRLKSYRLRHGE